MSLSPHADVQNLLKRLDVFTNCFTERRSFPEPSSFPRAAGTEMSLDFDLFVIQRLRRVSRCPVGSRIISVNVTIYPRAGYRHLSVKSAYYKPLYH